MNFTELTNNIRALIDTYAPKGTEFKWDNAKSRLGSCTYRYSKYIGYYDFKITISFPLATINDWETVRNTVIHEIAHARTPSHGHDAVWRRECIRLGGDGERLADGNKINTVPMKFIGVCPKCGGKCFRNRRTNGYHCDRTQPIVWKVNPKFLAYSA